VKVANWSVKGYAPLEAGAVPVVEPLQLFGRPIAGQDRTIWTFKFIHVEEYMDLIAERA